MYDEATTPGSSIPAAAVGYFRPNGFINPFRGSVKAPPALPTISRIGSTSSIIAPPNAFGGSNQVLTAIKKPLPPIGPSVVGTIADTARVTGVASLIREIPNAPARPFFPVGLRERVAEMLPEGIRKRAVSWQRATVRFRTTNSPSIPVARE